jgi:hypothetical protein
MEDGRPARLSLGSHAGHFCKAHMTDPRLLQQLHPVRQHLRPVLAKRTVLAARVE